MRFKRCQGAGLRLNVLFFLVPCLNHSFRMHEVVSRAVSLENGVRVAGLGPVEQPGVEDVDLTGTIDGHLELQKMMSRVLEVIKVDG